MMDNKLSIWQRIEIMLRTRISPHLPRWLITWGFNQVLDRCMTVDDWNHSTTVAVLYHRWTLGVDLRKDTPPDADPGR